MPKNSEIIRAVKEGLSSLEIAINGDWTEAVLTKLCRIGRSFDYKVYANTNYVPKTESDDGEWLYDVTWLKYEKNGHGELIEAPLVAECEWGDTRRIEDDFEKLLLARARVRVMIIDGGDKCRSEKIANLLAGKVRKFKFNGSRAEDTWLLAAWEQNGDAWQFRYFTIGSEPSATEC